MAQFSQKALGEVIALAAYKRARSDKRVVTVIIKAPALPPVPPYRTTKVDSPYGELKITVIPTPEGDWKVFVKFPAGFKIGDFTQSPSPNTPSQ